MIPNYGTKISKARSKTPITVQPPDSVGYIGTTEVFRFANSLLTVLEDSEEITYTNKQSGERWKANFCRHLKYSHVYSGNATQTMTARHNSADEHIDHGGVHGTAYSSHLQARTEAFNAHGVNYGVPKPLDTYQAYINTAAELVKPDLTTLSIPNFIFELRDLKQLLTLWQRKFDIKRNILSGLLNYSFGVKPTIGDLAGMFKSIQATSDALDRHQRLVGKRQQRSITLVEGESVFEEGEFAVNGTSPCFWTSSVKRNVECFVNYVPQPIPGVGSLATELRARMDALGFELNPSIIWNAVPFTFIFDMFIDIGKFLDRFKIDALALPILWADSFVQYKEEYLVESRYVHDYTSSTYSPGISIPAWSSKHEFFARAPVFPHFEVLRGLDWGFPSLNQAVLLLGLGASRRK